MIATDFAVTLVTDRRRLPAGRGLPDVAGEAAAAGLFAVQLREKDLGAPALLALARTIAQRLPGGRTKLVVNDRADVAFLAGAAGVQLPEEGIPAGDVRRAFPGLLVGASCHDADGVKRAADGGAHWAVLGPVFATPGKESRALGLGPLGEACRAVGIPVYAVGGIEAVNLAAVRGAGARGALAIRPFLGGDVREVAAVWRAALFAAERAP